MNHFVRIAALALSLLVLTGCFKSKEEQAIDQVRGGLLERDKSAPVGKVFSGYRYFASQSWNAFETDQGKQIVEFHGKIDLGKHIDDQLAALAADSQALGRQGMNGDAFFAVLGNAGLAERLKDPKYAMAAKDLKLSAKVLIQFILLPEEKFKVSYIEQRVEVDLAAWPLGDVEATNRVLLTEVEQLLGTEERGNWKVLDRIYANRPTPYPAAAVGIYDHYVAAKWR